MKSTFPWGSNRVNRGGSWNNTATNCRTANRNNNTPSNRNNNVGFRLAPQLSLGERCSRRGRTGNAYLSALHQHIAANRWNEIPSRQACLVRADAQNSTACLIIG